MKEKLYLEPKGEHNFNLHPLANINECMKSYEKKVGYLFTEQELKDLMHRCWMKSRKFYSGKTDEYFFDYFESEKKLF